MGHNYMGHNYILATASQARAEVHEAAPMANMYAVRNQLMRDVTTRYTLHLNYDTVGISAGCERRGWLWELVRHAEAHPQQWAVMPYLLESTQSTGPHVHVSWELAVATCVQHERPRLCARFNQEACTVPPPVMASAQPSTVPYLEDHCFLARTEHYPPQAITI